MNSTWLLRSIERLDHAYCNPETGGGFLAARIAQEAAGQCARMGLAELHAKGESFKSWAAVPDVQTYLAAILGALKPRESIPLLLSVDDVASILTMSPSHVYRLADGGKMPRPIKVGALVRWPRAEIESWIANGCKPLRK